MLTILSRRLTKFTTPIKLVTLLACATTSVYILWRVPPTIGSIAIFSLFIFIFLSALLSSFLNTNYSLLASTTVSFIFFLQAVDLLSLLNVALFVVFMILLSLYLWKK